MAQRNQWRSHDLGGEWTFAYSLTAPSHRPASSADLTQSGITTYPAQVPGNFELDLLAHGLIPGDPFFGNAIAALRPLEHAHVWYLRRFRADGDAGMEADLVFEGIDCIADVSLNGELLGTVDNMLIEHRLPVTGRLAADNELFIDIKPAVESAKTHHSTPSLSASPCSYDALFVRKAPHMYGWDIMPRALSAGVWRPVRLEYKPAERIEDTYLITRSIAGDRSSADLALWYSAWTSGSPQDEYEIVVEGQCEQSRFAERRRVLFDSGWIGFTMGDPRLWWPKGRGRPELYQVAVTLLKNGQPLDRRQFAHGIRTIGLTRTSTTDEAGSGDFCFVVNGERLFIHGTNWVPMDAYHSRDHERIPQAIALAEDLNCNMLRCWGGNVYEDDLFYDLCDQNGMLVWQDFAMACAVYPQTQEFQAQIAAEAGAVVRRLRQHPCIVLWAGDNECDQAHGWGAIQSDPNDNVLTRRTIPAVLRQEDPCRPYLPSSPYIDQEAYRKGDRFLPENHLWGPRDYYKGDYYRTSLCHFVSEIGYHGCPSPESIRKFISPDKVWPCWDNDEWQLHSTSPVPGMNIFGGRVELMANQIRALFGSVPETLDDFALASQITQAEAMKFFIEQARSGMPRTTGILWWNLIDGWPQFSDAVVDYYYGRKLAYDYIKAAQQPVHLLITDPLHGTPEVVAVNTTRQSVTLAYTLTDASTGERLASGEAQAAAGRVTSLADLREVCQSQRFILIAWEGYEQRGVSHALCGDPPFHLDQYRGWLTARLTARESINVSSRPA